MLSRSKNLTSDHVKMFATNMLNKFQPQQLDRLIDLLEDAQESGSQVLICGNGGSAALADHFAADLSKNLKTRIRAISLVSNAAVITAYANDEGFNKVFASQVSTLGNPGDILIIISSSGESQNVIAAASAAGEKLMTVVGFTGSKECTLDAKCDLVVKVPFYTYEFVEPAHDLLVHTVMAVLHACENSNP